MATTSLTLDNIGELPRILGSHGYAIIERVFSDDELEEMKREMATIIEQLRPEEQPKSIFSTLDEDKHASDKYFLDSASQISFFYEKDAFDSSGGLVVDKHAALNKVGHALHWLNPCFRRYSFHENIKKAIRAIGYEHPKIVQSMYIFKPRIGGAVLEHVDSTFLRTQPIEKLIGLWIALDDATEANGCLWFIPGSHRTLAAAADYRFVRTATRADASQPLVHFEGVKPSYDSSAFVAAPVKKGSMVLIHGLVVHKSANNTSAQQRHAYTLHVGDLADESKWSALNWLQPTADYKFPSLY